MVGFRVHRRGYDASTMLILRDGSREVLCCGVSYSNSSHSAQVRDVVRASAWDAVALQVCELRLAQLLTDVGRGRSLNVVGKLVERWTKRGIQSTRWESFVLTLEHLFQSLYAGPGDTQAFLTAAKEATALRLPCVAVDEQSARILEKLTVLNFGHVDFLSAYMDAWEDADEDDYEHTLPSNVPRPASEAVASTRAYARQVVAFWRTVNPEATRILIDDRAKVMVEKLKLRGAGRTLLVCHMLHLDALEEQWNSNTRIV